MSNIEDDLEEVKTFAEYSQEILNDTEYERPVDVTITQKEVSAIKNILQEREQDKARIKELEEKNRMFALEGSRVRLDLYIKGNYISKQKIKEILDKAEVMDYYTLPDVIDDLTKLLEAEDE